MISGKYHLIDAALIQQLKFETVANNLANIGVIGFKKGQISFNETLSMQYNSTLDLSPGPVRHTGNDFDIAINERGFFTVQTPDGLRYTRNGCFKVNADGLLSTQRGDPVLGRNGPISIAEGRLTVKRNGDVMVDEVTVDTLALVDVKNNAALWQEGDVYYRFQGEADELVPLETNDVQQRYTEHANVYPTEEMIKMVEAMRAFESTQKAIQTNDETTSKLFSMLGSN